MKFFSHVKTASELHLQEANGIDYFLNFFVGLRVISNVENETKSGIQLEPSWLAVLEDEFAKPYMQDLRAFLKTEIQRGKTIFPRPSEYFSALNSTAFEKVKVVILGQDPYHGPDQAHGLCFSVRRGVAIPPSLANIYKEYRADLGLETPDHGCLQSWAENGVLLLNAVLTVESGKAGAHQNRGWEKFTDRVIQELNHRRTGIAFILWGSYAQKKGQFIDRNKHLVLEAPHPSPLSAYRGFLGSQPFSKVNAFLAKTGEDPINWSMPR